MINLSKKDLVFTKTEKYIPIGRKMLKVDKREKNHHHYYLPQNSTPATIPPVKKGAEPCLLGSGEIVAVPTFNIACHPQFDHSEKRSWKTIKKASKQLIKRKEDTEIFALLEKSARQNQTVVTNEFNLISLNFAFGSLVSHNLVVDKVVMHPRHAETLKYEDRSLFFKGIKKWWFKRQGCVGKLDGAKIYVSDCVPDESVFILAKPENIGVILLEQDFKTIKKDDPEKLRRGRVFFESLGLCVINDYAISKVSVTHEEVAAFRRMEREKRK